jgi:hypothetical protein
MSSLPRFSEGVVSIGIPLRCDLLELPVWQFYDLFLALVRCGIYGSDVDDGLFK